MLNPSKYFRISLISQCNLNCYYCHREGNFSNETPKLTPQDLTFVCKVALKNGFKKFKLTGGEPTLRKDICEIVKNLSSLNLPDLSIITNGTKLVELAENLWKAGLRRLNVTLNTINLEKFKFINRQTKFSDADFSALLKKIIAGIDAAQNAGFKNIKLNFVYNGERSNSDLAELIDFSKSRNCILVVLPIIEEKSFYRLDYLYDLIKKQFKIQSKENFSDAEGIFKRLIYLENGARILLWIDELSERRPYIFCQNCLAKKQCREGIFPIRLSAQGKLIPCMASAENRIDLLTAIKNRDTQAADSAFKKIESWYCQ